MQNIDKKNSASIQTYQVTLIDSYIRPKTTYEKITKVANDWAFPAFLATMVFILVI